MALYQFSLFLSFSCFAKLAFGQPINVQMQPSEKAHIDVIFAQCCQNSSSCTRWRNTTGLGGSNGDQVMDLCALAGNTCNSEGFLQALDASSMNMACSFPVAELSQLTTLQYLNMSNNENINGSLDRLNKQYICFMAQNSLTELDLSFTGIDGSVPDCLLADSGLKTLALRNTLVSSLPDAFTVTSQLESIDISNAALAGLLPASVAFAPKLKVLKLNNNLLGGQIPEFSQDTIEVVDLSGNYLIGGVPHSLATHPSLSLLDASNNQLTSLPIEWTESVYNASEGAPFPVKGILLSDNKLQGAFPVGLSAFPALETLNLSNNSLTGEIPSANSISWFPSLKFLDISTNMFAGALPTWVSQVNESITTGNRFGTPVPPVLNAAPAAPPPSTRSPSRGAPAPVTTTVGSASKDSSTSSTGGLSGGAVAGIVIASLIVASLVAGGAFFVLRRRQYRNTHGKFDRFVDEGQAASDSVV